MNQYSKLLGSISQNVASELIAHARLRYVGTGEVIASLGKPFIGTIVRGWVRLTRFDAQGTQYFVCIRRPGRFIGLETAIGADTPLSEVVALGPGELLVWPAQGFSALTRSDLSLAIEVARVLAFQTEEEIAARHQARTVRLAPRIVQLLLLYAAEMGERTAMGYRVMLPFNQHTLAELLEVRRESVSSNICGLENAELIVRNGRELMVNTRLARLFLSAAGLPDDQNEDNTQYRSTARVATDSHGIAQASERQTHAFSVPA